MSSVLAGRSWVAAVLLAAVALLGTAAVAAASPVLEFSHGKTRVVQDDGTPPVTPADVAASIATAAQAPPEHRRRGAAAFAASAGAADHTRRRPRTARRPATPPSVAAPCRRSSMRRCSRA